MSRKDDMGLPLGPNVSNKRKVEEVGQPHTVYGSLSGSGQQPGFTISKIVLISFRQKETSEKGACDTAST